MNKWINNEGKVFIMGYLDIDDMRVFNPTDEQLIAAGYHVYEEPNIVIEPSIEWAKEQKIEEINQYDNSPEVNSFTIGDQQMWLTVAERQQIATQISANEAVGRDSMTKWFNGQQFTFSLAQWKQMLTALEIYAGDALNVTEAHKAEVNALDNIEDIYSYDVTAGYPEKLSFTIG